jgi:hypothetical protein
MQIVNIRVLKVVSAVAIVLLVTAASNDECLGKANRVSARAMDAYDASNIEEAISLESGAARELQSCLETQKITGLGAKQRLGELWQSAGEYAVSKWERNGKHGDVRDARAFLLKAKEIYAQLRRSQDLKGTMLDEVISSAHDVDGFLQEIAKHE